MKSIRTCGALDDKRKKEERKKNNRKQRRVVYYRQAIHFMIVCFIKINDNMQMTFIKLHNVCAALHFRTSYTKPGQHQAGTVELLVSSYTDPNQRNRNR